MGLSVEFLEIPENYLIFFFNPLVKYSLILDQEPIAYR